MLVRKFSRDGKELGRHLPSSLWPGRKAAPDAVSGGYWQMRAATDRIGVLVHANHADNQPEWVEWDFEGQVLTRTILKDDLHGHGRAYTSDGRLYAQFNTAAGKKELRMFNPNTGGWAPVSVIPPEDRAFLLGSDGIQLAFSLDSRVVLQSTQ